MDTDSGQICDVGDNTDGLRYPHIMPVILGGRCIAFDESRSVSMWRCVLCRLSELEKSEVWDRFEGGGSQRSISRRLGRSPSTIRTLLVGSGFRRPVSGPEWSALRLTLSEREEISRGLAAGESLRCVADRLGRAPSTVSREVAANGGRRRYRATSAHRMSRHRVRRLKPAKLVLTISSGRWWRTSLRTGGRHGRYWSGWLSHTLQMRRCE